MFKSNMETRVFLSKSWGPNGRVCHINFIVKKIQIQSDQTIYLCVHPLYITVYVSDIIYEKCCFVGCLCPPPLTADKTAPTLSFAGMDHPPP